MIRRFSFFVLLLSMILLSSFSPSFAQSEAPAVPVPSASTETPSRSSVEFSKRPVVYLTFDDGPAIGNRTEKLVDFLKIYDIPATFFVVGKMVRTNPESLVYTYEHGHVIANHSNTHADLSKLSPEGQREEFLSTQEAVFEAIGVEPVCFRAPYGASNSSVEYQAGEVGLLPQHLGWDVDTNDWRYDRARITDSLNSVDDADVILMHDGPGERVETYAALMSWIEINHDNYVFRPVPECMEKRKVVSPQEFLLFSIDVAEDSSSVSPTDALSFLFDSPSGLLPQ